MADLAAAIDSVTTLDLGVRSGITALARAARREQGSNPGMQAADVLVDCVNRGDVVGVLTGFSIPPEMTQETDGPPGAAVLARAIGTGLDADVIIVCDPGAVKTCEAVVAEVGFDVVDRADGLGDRSAVTIEALPSSPDRVTGYLDSFAGVSPAAFVTVEKAAPNRAGVYHNMTGHDISSASGRIEEFLTGFESVPLIGIGDGGNEVGMGVIEDTVRDEIEYGSVCQCPCGAGIAAAIDADVLVPATVSNWGASAITAGLAHRTGTAVLHDPAAERRMLEAAADTGAIDGIAGGTTGWCDGMPPAIHESIVRLLHGVLRTHGDASMQ